MSSFGVIKTSHAGDSTLAEDSVQVVCMGYAHRLWAKVKCGSCINRIVKVLLKSIVLMKSFRVKEIVLVGFRRVKLEGT